MCKCMKDPHVAGNRTTNDGKRTHGRILGEKKYGYRCVVFTSRENVRVWKKLKVANLPWYIVCEHMEMIVQLFSSCSGVVCLTNLTGTQWVERMRISVNVELMLRFRFCRQKSTTSTVHYSGHYSGKPTVARTEQCLGKCHANSCVRLSFHHPSYQI